MLQLLLPQLVLDGEAEGNRTLLAVLLAVLGVVAAQGNQLLAHRATTVGLSLATLGVLHHPLHLLAGRQGAVGIATLAGVDQGLDAALDAQTPTLLRALGGLATLAVAVVVQAQAALDHLMLVAFRVVAVNAKINVLIAERKRDR